MRWYSWKLWRLAWGLGPRKVVDGDGTWTRVGNTRVYWLQGKEAADGPLSARLGLFELEMPH